MRFNVIHPPKIGNKTIAELRDRKAEQTRRHGSLRSCLALADFESVIAELKSRANTWDSFDAESAEYDRRQAVI